MNGTARPLRRRTSCARRRTCAPGSTGTAAPSPRKEKGTMKRSHALLAAVALIATAQPALAQTGEALIRKVGAGVPIANPSFPAQKDLVYKVAWYVTEGPPKPEEATAGFARPANFLVMADANGLDRKKVHLAIIVYGPAP